MLQTDITREIVLDIIHVPLNLRSGNLSDVQRSLLIKGFVKGFQVSLYIATGLMTVGTVAVLVLVKDIPLTPPSSEVKEIN